MQILGGKFHKFFSTRSSATAKKQGVSYAFRRGGQIAADNSGLHF